MRNRPKSGFLLTRGEGSGALAGVLLAALVAIVPAELATPAAPVTAQQSTDTTASGFRDPDAGVQFYMPPGWKSDAGDDGVTLTSPDGTYTIQVWTDRTSASFADAAANLGATVCSRLADCRVEGAERKVPDMEWPGPTAELAGNATANGSPIFWRADLLGAKLPVVVLYTNTAMGATEHGGEAATFRTTLQVMQDTAAPAPSALPAAVFENPIPAAQLAFLGGYVGRPTAELMRNGPFRALMRSIVPRTEFHYGRDTPLFNAIDTVLEGSMLRVESVDGRYVTVSGFNGPHHRGRGFLWFDMQSGDALGVFYFEPGNGEPTPTVTVFSTQLTDTSLGISQLPPAFAEELDHWALAARIPAVTPRYFIPADGKKYVLVHDQDYCDPRPNAPPPDAGTCQQLNADAAEDDMNAAYFMKETHNAANATAWMLGSDQVAWIGLRDRSCGNGLACRIAITRERTRVLLGPPAPRPHGRGR